MTKSDSRCWLKVGFCFKPSGAGGIDLELKSWSLSETAVKTIGASSVLLESGCS